MAHVVSQKFSVEESTVDILWIILESNIHRGGSSLLQIAATCFKQVQVAIPEDTVRCLEDSAELHFAGASLTHVQMRIQGSKGVLAVSSLAALQDTSSAP